MIALRSRVILVPPRGRGQGWARRWARQGGAGAGQGSIERRSVRDRGGGGRGRARTLGRAAPVGEDGLHGAGILHGGDDAEAAATAGAGQDFEIEHAAHEPRTRPWGSGGAGRGGVDLVRARGGVRAAAADDVRAPADTRGQHAMAHQPVCFRPRPHRRQPLQQLERVGDHIRFHPRVLELAGHYHFAPQPCAVARGNEKGRVERFIGFLRPAFFAARPFSSVADLNTQLTRWIAEVAHARPVPARREQRVADALAEEQPRLLPLPEHPFPTDLLRAVSSGKTPYIRFDGNDYSIPHSLVRRPLTLVASEHVVRVLDGSTEVARHARRYDRGQRIEDDAHLAALVAEKRRAHDLRGRDRLRQACPHAAAFVEALAVRGHPLARETTHLLRLLDQVGAPALEAALTEALARGAVSAASVAHVLDHRRRAAHQPPLLDLVLPADPRVRDLRVTPHALSAYDTLLTPPPAADEERPDASPR